VLHHLVGDDPFLVTWATKINGAFLFLAHSTISWQQY
jgi:hypothetical protein